METRSLKSLASVIVSLLLLLVQPLGNVEFGSQTVPFLRTCFQGHLLKTRNPRNVVESMPSKLHHLPLACATSVVILATLHHSVLCQRLLIPVQNIKLKLSHLSLPKPSPLLLNTGI